MPVLPRLLLASALTLGLTTAHAAEWTALAGGGDGAQNLALAWQSAPLWRGQLAAHPVDLSLEASAGRFRRDQRNTWHVGLTPFVRWWMSSHDALEAGIGANLLSSVYIGPKGLSTAYQFGDSIGVLHRFGASPWSAGVRVTHYSNAGVKHPNPGQNFLQLRLSYDY